MEALVCSTLFISLSLQSRINLGENGSMSLLYHRAESIQARTCSMSLLYYRAESILVKMEALVCSTLFISLSPQSRINLGENSTVVLAQIDSALWGNKEGRADSYYSSEVCEDNFFETETEDETRHGHNLEVEARVETFPEKFSRLMSRTRLSPCNFLRWRSRTRLSTSRFSRPRSRTRLAPQNFRDRGQDLSPALQS